MGTKPHPITPFLTTLFVLFVGTCFGQGDIYCSTYEPKASGLDFCIDEPKGLFRRNSESPVIPVSWGMGEFLLNVVVVNTVPEGVRGDFDYKSVVDMLQKRTETEGPGGRYVDVKVESRWVNGRKGFIMEANVSGTDHKSCVWNTVSDSGHTFQLQWFAPRETFVILKHTYFETALNTINFQ